MNKVRAGDGGTDILHGGCCGLAAQFHRAMRAVAQWCLCRGMDADAFHALHPAFAHVFDRMAAAMADADDFDLCFLAEILCFSHVDVGFEIDA